MSVPVAVLLQRIIKLELPYLFSQTVYGGGVISMELLICWYCVHVFLYSSKPEIRPARWSFTALTILLLFLDVFARVCNMNFAFYVLRKPNTARQYIQLHMSLSAAASMRAADWTIAINTWLGQALLIYRCFVVWQKKWIVAVLPGVLLLSVIGINMHNLISPPQNLPLYRAFWSLSAALNTILSVLLAWGLHRIQIVKFQLTISENPDSEVKNNTTFGIMGFIAESAMLLAISTILRAVCYGQAGVHPENWRPWRIAECVSASLWDVASVVTPQWIVWRVILRYSFAHNTEEMSILGPPASLVHQRPAGGRRRRSRSKTRNGSEPVPVTLDLSIGAFPTRRELDKDSTDEQSDKTTGDTE